MKALLVATGEMPKFIEVNGLDDLQQAVGGYIDSASWIFNDKPAVYLNDEGKFSKEPNRAVYATKEHEGSYGMFSGEPCREGDLLDVIYGDFVCIGFNERTGEDRDITSEEADQVMRTFGNKASIDSGVVESLRIMLGIR